jgi:hypothetical protein
MAARSTEHEIAENDLDRWKHVGVTTNFVYKYSVNISEFADYIV